MIVLIRYRMIVLTSKGKTERRDGLDTTSFNTFGYDSFFMLQVSQKRSFLGRGGITGLAMTVDVLDALGSSMSNLNANSGFISTTASRGNKISILAFEVANTIAKGANLFQSLSDENIQFLKKEILNSEAVQKLVSTDMKELLRIAAADKRLFPIRNIVFLCSVLSSTT